VTIQVIRKDFQTRLDEWKREIDEHEKRLTPYIIQAGGSQSSAASATTAGLAISHQPTSSSPSQISGNYLIESAIQSQLLQIWSEFLSRLLEYKIEKYLKGHGFKKIDKEIDARLDFPKLDDLSKKSLIDLISSGCRQAFDQKFFGRQYTEFRKKKLFRITNENPYKKIILKHVIIRNLFQHHQGKYIHKIVDKTDGYNVNDFKILDENSNMFTPNNGDVIKLSCLELKKLCEAIEKMINNIKFK